MMPLVSVIIPIYNADVYLEETILSVLNQTYKSIELILVNHCSTDRSAEIIEKFKIKDARVKVITLNINKGGPAYPRNEGLKVARGEFVAFVDSDDVWLNNKLLKQVKLIVETKVDIIHTLAYIIDKNSTEIGIFNNQNIYNILKYCVNSSNIIYYTNYININSVLMKNDKKILFSEEKNLIAVEDWFYWINAIYSNKKILLLEEKLIKYRIHDMSISHRNSDIGYKKSLYLLSLLLLENKISRKHYLFSSLQLFLKLFKV